MWKAVEGGGVNVRLLRGDVDDPLAGSVRLTRAGDRVVDVVVGRHGWQRDIVDAGEPVSIGEVSVDSPGRQDWCSSSCTQVVRRTRGTSAGCWRATSRRMRYGPRSSLALPKLPAECRVLWNRVRSGH